MSVDTGKVTVNERVERMGISGARRRDEDAGELVELGEGQCARPGRYRVLGVDDDGVALLVPVYSVPGGGVATDWNTYIRARLPRRDI